MKEYIDNKNNRTLPEELLWDTFKKLQIESKFYPIFCQKADRYYNEDWFDDDQFYIDYSLGCASSYVKMINKGLSELWAYTYTELKVRYLYEDVDSAFEAYNLIRDVKGKAQAEKELMLYASSVDEDPHSIDLLVLKIKKYVLIETTPEYKRIVNIMIAAGKSAIYAKRYALEKIGGLDDDFCHIYASMYEDCIINGRYQDFVNILRLTCYEICSKLYPKKERI